MRGVGGTVAGARGDASTGSGCSRPLPPLDGLPALNRSQTLTCRPSPTSTLCAVKS